jgi:periplasmic divalent cation tolerance protein
MDDHLLVLSTCPDNATAERLATMLVEQRLAACVNVLPGLTSVYRWQGEIQRDSEVLLLAKSRADRYPHPYELPEVVAVSLEQGLEGYLAWLDRALGDTE